MKYHSIVFFPLTFLSAVDNYITAIFLETLKKNRESEVVGIFVINHLYLLWNLVVQNGSRKSQVNKIMATVKPTQKPHIEDDST